MRAVRVGVLLSWLPAAYGGFAYALSGAGQPLIVVLAVPSVAANLPAPAPTREDDQRPADLSTYIYLHKTRSESIAVPIAAGLGVRLE